MIIQALTKLTIDSLNKKDIDRLNKINLYVENNMETLKKFYIGRDGKKRHCFWDGTSAYVYRHKGYLIGLPPEKKDYIITAQDWEVVNKTKNIGDYITIEDAEKIIELDSIKESGDILDMHEIVSNSI